MQDIHSRLAMLKRPPLLARAARCGADEYRRSVHLRRILQVDPLPRSADALMRLLDIEQEMERERVVTDGHYAIARHVAVLIAIAGEARLMQATYPRPV